jgi:hypothetical protein
MITELNYKNKVYKIDTTISTDRELLGNIQQNKFEDFLNEKGYIFTPIENKYCNYDFYNEKNNEAVIIELKSTTKDINDFPTELINVSKIEGIYNKVLENRKKGIKTTTLIIYSYNNEYRLLKLKWDLINKLETRMIFNKLHYILKKSSFEPIDNIDKYISNFKKELTAH